MSSHILISSINQLGISHLDSNVSGGIKLLVVQKIIQNSGLILHVKAVLIMLIAGAINPNSYLTVK